MGSQCLKRVLTPWCPQLPRAPCEHLPPVRAFSSVEPRTSPTAESLCRLQSVKNIRDLSEACSNIAPGRLFRSACPVGAVPEDVQVLQQGLKIHQMIDLRSEYERQHDLPLTNGLLSRAVYRKNSRRGLQIETEIEDALGRRSSGNAAVTIDLLSFLERDRYYKAMLARLPYQTSASLLFWGLFNQSYAKTLAIQEINKAGLPGLYEVILETAGPEIKQALQVILDAAEGQIPLLFFCKIGKDRTGLLSLLVLACCGATDDEIVSDYARSDGINDIGLGGIEKDKELKELDTAQFSRAPPDVMQKTLKHLKERYGGARGYLDSIGFSQNSQQRLAESLASSEGRENGY